MGNENFESICVKYMYVKNLNMFHPRLHCQVRITYLISKDIVYKYLINTKDKLTQNSKHTSQRQGSRQYRLTGQAVTIVTEFIRRPTND